MTYAYAIPKQSPAAPEPEPDCGQEPPDKDPGMFLVIYLLASAGLTAIGVIIWTLFK